MFELRSFPFEPCSNAMGSVLEIYFRGSETEAPKAVLFGSPSASFRAPGNLAACNLWQNRAVLGEIRNSPLSIDWVAVVPVSG
jgi:hypothetical protein